MTTVFGRKNACAFSNKKLLNKILWTNAKSSSIIKVNNFAYAKKWGKQNDYQSFF
jgi:hypothetical protein